MFDFCCPRCKGPLEASPEHYRCRACGETYPVVLGIPDFRVFPDPYIGYADDRAKGSRVVAGMDRASFAELVRRYWELTPDVPRHLVDSYVSHVLGAAVRAQSTLADARAAGIRLGAREAASHGPLLEVGCGTGGLLIAAARDYEQVVGVDIAFRWLVIAARRVAEAVVTGELTAEQAARIQLVCACAESLPLPDAGFDVVIGANVLEHASRQADLLAQSHRALRPRGLLFLTTVNRLSLAPEPHVKVWGVGLLPRRWMSPFVQRVRGVPYRHIRLRSMLGLVAGVRAAGFQDWEVRPARVADVDLGRYSPVIRAGARAYEHIRGLPGGRQVLGLFGPLLQVAAVA
ncbi:MAG TPA: methyltransferase domain-containing protein [Chloroflexota bacterium]|nr:methyltransferase domain-containing protein [Chloroflexota bacterium]